MNGGEEGLRVSAPPRVGRFVSFMPSVFVVSIP
jgi:hypothetical protein